MRQIILMNSNLSQFVVSTLSAVVDSSCAPAFYIHFQSLQTFLQTNIKIAFIRLRSPKTIGLGVVVLLASRLSLSLMYAAGSAATPSAFLRQTSYCLLANVMSFVHSYFYLLRICMVRSHRCLEYSHLTGPNGGGRGIFHSLPGWSE